MHTEDTTDVLSGRIRILARKVQSLEKALQPAGRKIVIFIVWQAALLVTVVLLAKVIWHL